ncbi:FKBP-type peptidyl-prolyl cis-trans isomerase [Alkalitalea saponilacus]|uniref:Peptidyl-prolyl cis-trans isomerase n=1 Tax=Alkalitalea saponilacus TaxID=889453 RepID=A0A1T5G4M1_9BACT|nr:FKBP-type peptidyl-prolyl cis-trans isomerase [Alkalitalea saponilacus]ASB47852.1 peptidylprolyl isomerase [Alkalitalea saponilacus]SKC03282.1 FKBP-type peptidyl-prolyl cis-trans isomerase FklB [Alkalitalea saponilacus]
MDKVSYALGMNIAHNLSSNGMETVNYDDFLSGFRAVMEKKNAAMDGNEANQVLNAHFSALEAEKQKANKQAGEAFLVENAKREGVITLKSGLQYEVVQDGDGKTPSATDQVKCHYHGTLIDGTVFDSSIQRGEPAVFPVNGVIQGWVEALQMMKEGSKWRLYVPSSLAYGSRGAGGAIGPDTTLIFEVELIGIEK